VKRKTAPGLTWVGGEREWYDLDETSCKNLAASSSGTSIFDPVLCELAYTWFCPPGGRVLDPFAGGSVRGIVAARLGREYTGIDLSERQVEANRVQAADIFGAKDSSILADPETLTPIEKHGAYFVKRDDLFSIGGVRGGKVRTCLSLAYGASGLTTAGSRWSPQVNIVAHIAKFLGIPCRVHTPTGELSPEVNQAKAIGAEVIQHKAGYNNVIIKRARDDATSLGWVNIPFGMECHEAVEQTRKQVVNIPPDTKRIVITVGSAMSLAGILWGMLDNDLTCPVLGVRVGADPAKRLDKYAPSNWRKMVDLVDSGLDYHESAVGTKVGDIALDSIYEGKCIHFLEENDLLWVVGIRKTEAPRKLPCWIVGDSRNLSELVNSQFDFIFSCPPYYDLEVYSDNEHDLSTLGTYEEFIVDYRAIIAQSVQRLTDDRFACFAVGDIRDKKGIYRNFVSDTIAAFQDAGAMLYNEAILVTALGSLPIRAGRQFSAGRKLGKTHQNVLVFVKGDWRKATEACGPVKVMEFGEVTTRNQQ